MSNLFKALVSENIKVAKDHFLLTLTTSSEIDKPKPGNFFMLSVESTLDPLLKRPLSLHNADGDTLQFLYRVQGHGTAILSTKKEGEMIELLGPLGNHFPISGRRKKVILAAGGIGIAPMLYLADRVKSRGPVLFYGARDKQGLLLIDKINKMNIDIHTATDDGSSGRKGTAVDLISNYFRKRSISKDDYVIYACGPSPMLRALSVLSGRLAIPCYAAMERNMACGAGTCLGCVIKTKSGYKRVCREGPVFNLDDIEWNSD